MADEKSDGAKLFVGQVPRQMGEDELRKIFEPYGEIIDLIILRDKVTGNHKGCAFVTFRHHSEADKAIEGLHNKSTLHPTKRPMQIKYAGADAEQKGEYKLFVGMLAKSTTADQIQDLFSQFGNVKEVYTMRDSSGQSKGCAFVKFENRDHAQKAINSLNEIYQDAGSPRRLIVRWADNKDQRTKRIIAKQIPFGEISLAAALPALAAAAGRGAIPASLASSLLGGLPGRDMYRNDRELAQPAIGPYGAAASPYGGAALGGYGSGQAGYGLPAGPAAVQQPAKGPSGCNLFILNIPDNFDDGDLYAMFSNFGMVISATVFKDKMTGFSKGFGFVSYDNPSSADKAIKSLDGFMIGNKRLKVSLKKGEGSGSSSSRSGGFQPY